MNILSRWSRVQLLALLVLSLFASKPAVADFPETKADGWYTWRVEAAADAPDWCCYRWNRGVATAKSCDLDKDSGGFSSSDDSGMGDELQIYALMKSGKAKDIRALSASCPVKSKAKIIDLGVLAGDDSVKKLRPYIDTKNDIGSDALAAIAAHAGKASLRVLQKAAESGPSADIREEAYFWMAVVRGPEATNELKQLLFGHSDAKFREEAAFAYSQSKISDRFDTLIKLGNEDRNADVRSQAWFWLAESGSAKSEAAIRYAIVNDKNQDVQEEAIFALSQLPEERAVKALAAVLEDRSLDEDLREEALFWLAQSDSDEALVYVDQLFDD